MKYTAISALFVFLLINTANASLFKIKISLNQFDEAFSENGAPEGWKRIRDGGFTKSFEVKSLPWNTHVGSTSFEISRKGVFTAGYSYGDADGTVRTSFNIPKSGGKFVLGDQPCEIALGGGDNASGAWGVDAKIVISAMHEAVSRSPEELDDHEWDSAKTPNMDGYAKMDEGLQNWADDPTDPRKFRAVATLVKSDAKSLKALEKFLTKTLAPKGLKFWISKSKKTVTLYGTISLVTEALAHDNFDSAK